MRRQRRASPCLQVRRGLGCAEGLRQWGDADAGGAEQGRAWLGDHGVGPCSARETKHPSRAALSSSIQAIVVVLPRAQVANLAAVPAAFLAVPCSPSTHLPNPALPALLRDVLAVHPVAALLSRRHQIQLCPLCPISHAGVLKPSPPSSHHRRHPLPSSPSELPHGFSLSLLK
ncbi:hypothetical protein M0R45_019392 [Rubus argutus]|uniref:Uncharacterized protein n=1 Tax=Rubus argutus TaxID=59490 RepID=A0AAW1X7R7_RUBAR